MKKHAPILKMLGRNRLWPLVQYCAKTPGAITEVCKQMEMVTGFRPNWTQCSNWVNVDEKKWQMPTYGNGIVLEHIQSTLVKKAKNKQVTPCKR